MGSALGRDEQKDGIGREKNARPGEGMRRHHEEREHRGERRYWEDEEELWEQVAQGLKAAFALDRMSEGEARETWEEGGTMKTKIISTIMMITRKSNILQATFNQP